MAAHAGCRRAFEVAAHVAGGARQTSVRAGQGEARKLEVVEVHAHPRIHVVALLA